jgi:YHS domain-containing protein/quercetin dioxygenase-like cupin family protein
MKTLALLVILFPVSLSSALAAEPTNPAAAVLREHILVAPGDIQWTGCSAALPPGAQCAAIEGDLAAANVLFTYRVRFPAGYVIPPHFHPADEHLTVIEGTFHLAPGSRFDKSRTRAMTRGSFMVMPKGHPHFAWTDSETIVQVHAIGPWGLTYVNPQDDPRSRAAIADEFFEVDGVALRGFDVVAYFDVGKPVPGRKAFSHTYRGSDFLFASDENREKFAANPEKYAPQYGGFCALGTANGYKVATEPDAFKIVDGKLYFNYNRKVLELWTQDQPGNIARANENWPKVSGMPMRE